MAATRFERPAAAAAAAALFAAAALAATMAAFAIGQARAQPVTPPIPPPSPTFNPSMPNTVAQPPVAPLAPSAPSGLGTVPLAAPSTPAIEPPQTLNPPTTNPPTTNQPTTTAPTPAPAPAKPALSPVHARHHGHVRHRWRRRYGRYHARVLGPAYYPGVGEFYPPYPNLCHRSEVWSGYYAPYWTYSCSW